MADPKQRPQRPGRKEMIRKGFQPNHGLGPNPVPPSGGSGLVPAQRPASDSPKAPALVPSKPPE